MLVKLQDPPESLGGGLVLPSDAPTLDRVRRVGTVKAVGPKVETLEVGMRVLIMVQQGTVVDPPAGTNEYWRMLFEEEVQAHMPGEES